MSPGASGPTSEVASGTKARSLPSLLVLAGVAAGLLAIVANEALVAAPAIWLGSRFGVVAGFSIGVVLYVVVSAAVAFVTVAAVARARRSSGRGRLVEGVTRSLQSRRGAFGAALVSGGKMTGFVGGSLLLGPVPVAAMLCSTRGASGARRLVVPSSLIWSIGMCAIYSGVGGAVFHSG